MNLLLNYVGPLIITYKVRLDDIQNQVKNLVLGVKTRGLFRAAFTR
jgi:hypothetical protein